MIGQILFDKMIMGVVSTNSNRTTIQSWRETLERNFASFPSLHLSGKISIKMKFWLSPSRLGEKHRNDLDNLSKPVFDAMKRIGVIRDDSAIFHLEVSKFPTSSEEGIYIQIKEWV